MAPRHALRVNGPTWAEQMLWAEKAVPQISAVKMGNTVCRTLSFIVDHLEEKSIPDYHNRKQHFCKSLISALFASGNSPVVFFHFFAILSSERGVFHDPDSL